MEWKPVTTKLGRIDRNASLYPYYAGFSLEFARWSLVKMGVERDAAVLDPWSGAGTTLAAARALNAHSTGHDVNPVMVTVSRAQSAPRTAVSRVLAAIETANDAPAHSDGMEAITEFYKHVKAAGNLRNGYEDDILLTTLFPIVRFALSKSRTKNPSWFSAKRSKTEGRLLDGSLRDLVSASAHVFQERHNARMSKGPRPEVLLQDSRSPARESERYDLMLTSPPYLTRIDYVKATLPELTLLRGLNITDNLDSLRRKMLGTPLTERVDLNTSALPNSVLQVLAQIADHPSKASSTYYLRFFARYFLDLQSSLQHSFRSLKAGGRACIVVQPSSYKNILVDLPRLTIDIASSVASLELQDIYEFDSRNSMSLVNSRAHPSARAKKSESAVFLKKLGNNR